MSTKVGAIHDVEDILNLVDGRDALVVEVRQSPRDVRSDIARGVAELLGSRDVDYVIASAARGSAVREGRIRNRLNELAAMID